MTVVIIEDEIPAAKRLENLLHKKGFTVLISLSSVADSINWFKSNNHPDLVFMDIKLRDNLSFKIFEAVEIKSKIIFTTAFDGFALKAFDYNSVDYLLKPIDEKKLDKLVNKIELFTSSFIPNEVIKNIQLQDSNSFKTSFLIVSGNSLKKIYTNEIVCFYSYNNSSFLVTNFDKNYIINHSLEKLESVINSNQFFRISRKHIVNKDYISKVVNYKVHLPINNYDLDLKISFSKFKAFTEWYEK
jgi:DNA-binding LytR/AlgR family response regulator